jgi:hypothetical protein
VAAAVLTALGAIAGLLLTQRANKLKDVAEAHRAAKVEVYRRFMNFVTTALMASKTTAGTAIEEPFGPDFQRQFVEFTSELVLWGSPGVLNKFAAWRIASQVSGIPESLFAVDDLLQAIRKDLRNSNKGVKRGDLIRLYLKDPTELDRPGAGTSSGLGMTIEDEAALFVAAYGPSDEESSSEHEVPLPPLVTRSLVYKPENVRAVFIADAPLGAPPPYARWKLLGFQNEATDQPLDAAQVAQLLAKRKLSTATLGERGPTPRSS